MLESVAAGADNLSVEILKDLTKVMLCGHAAYDETTGMLKSTNDAPPTSIGIAPEPWRHPDAKIAAAQEAYKAALKAAAPRAENATGIGTTGADDNEAARFPGRVLPGGCEVTRAGAKRKICKGAARSLRVDGRRIGQLALNSRF